MKRILTFWNFLLITTNLIAQVEIGQKAPPIHVDKWIENPEYHFRNYHGKAIVLDFWFTHCAPCVYTIPHLNELSAHYKNQDVVFVAISFEHEDDILRFLSKKKIQANIGSDTLHRTIKAYEVEAYPQTFLIDKEGVLRWSGYPSHLNADLVDAVLEKKYFPTIGQDRAVSLSNPNKDFTTETIYPISVSINDYMDEASGLLVNQSELSIVNQSIDEVMALLLETSKPRINIEDTNRYDVRFKIPEELPKDVISEEIAKSLLNELGCQLRFKQELVNGYHLKISNDSLFIENAINPNKIYYRMGTTTDAEFWKGKGAQIADLIRELENRFGVLIDDKTELFGYFEFKFPISDFETASTYLMEKYGLEITNNLINVDIVEISPVN